MSKKEALGRRAIEILLWCIEHPDSPIEILLAGDFLLRQSASAAP